MLLAELPRCCGRLHGMFPRPASSIRGFASPGRGRLQCRVNGPRHWRSGSAPTWLLVDVQRDELNSEPRVYVVQVKRAACCVLYVNARLYAHSSSPPPPSCCCTAVVVYNDQFYLMHDYRQLRRIVRVVGGACPCFPLFTSREFRSRFPQPVSRVASGGLWLVVTTVRV